MNASRIRVALAVTVLGVGLSTGTAAAQLQGNSFSEELPKEEERTPPPDRELPFTPDEEPRSDALPASQSELPFTGGDVAGMVVMGAAAVGIGTVMVRRSRTRTAE